MRFVFVLVAMVVGAIGGIWLSVSLFPGEGFSGPLTLGGMSSFFLGCWTYLGIPAADGRRPDPQGKGTQLVFLAIGLGVAAIHLLLIAGIFGLSQR